MYANMNIWTSFFERKKQQLSKADQLRSLSAYDTVQGAYIVVGERRWLNLSSNDYLGLSTDAFAREDIQVLCDILPIGSGASRLITGSLAIHTELEKSLAAWKGTPRALVFASGYQTNVGVLSSLGRRGDSIFGDKLNHASLHDGALMSDATYHRYAHADAEDLEFGLSKQKRGRAIIATDAIFSMEGDIAPLPEIYDIARRFNALLIVDEAHATGVMGASGAGAWEHFGLPWDENIILMGTLSKAVGVQGGFVCGSEAAIDYFINSSRSFIYSTGLSPLLAGVAHANVTRIQSEPERRKKLADNIKAFHDALAEAGVDAPRRDTPIIPIRLGENQKALDCAARLRDEGYAVVAIRPPTVPEGEARLRISISAAHDPRDLADAAWAIARLVNETA